MRAWGFEPQRISAQEPKGDVTLVKDLDIKVKNVLLTPRDIFGELISESINFEHD